MREQDSPDIKEGYLDTADGKYGEDYQDSGDSQHDHRQQASTSAAIVAGNLAAYRLAGYDWFNGLQQQFIPYLKAWG
jgi:hypothetical protein